MGRGEKWASLPLFSLPIIPCALSSSVTIFAYDCSARLANVITFDHPPAHNFHLRHPHMCRTDVVGHDVR